MSISRSGTPERGLLSDFAWFNANWDATADQGITNNDLKGGLARAAEFSTPAGFVAEVEYIDWEVAFHPSWDTDVAGAGDLPVWAEVNTDDDLSITPETLSSGGPDLDDDDPRADAVFVEGLDVLDAATGIIAPSVSQQDTTNGVGVGQSATAYHVQEHWEPDGGTYPVPYPGSIFLHVAGQSRATTSNQASVVEAVGTIQVGYSLREMNV